MSAGPVDPPGFASADQDELSLSPAVKPSRPSTRTAQPRKRPSGGGDGDDDEDEKEDITDLRVSIAALRERVGAVEGKVDGVSADLRAFRDQALRALVGIILFAFLSVLLLAFGVLALVGVGFSGETKYGNVRIGGQGAAVPAPPAPGPP